MSDNGRLTEATVVNRFMALLDFFWDNPGEPVPEETFWTHVGHIKLVVLRWPPTP